MAHQFETGFFVKDPAWHELGKVLSEAPTIAEGIIKAGLDWLVLEQPVFSQDDLGNLIKAPEHKAFVRSSDNSTLGIVSKNYKPLQNIDAFNWFDFLLNEGDATLDAAGSLKKGRKVWVLAKINNTSVGEVRDGDLVNPYLLLHNSHDGSSAIWIQYTPIRVVCNNTLTFASSTRYQDEIVGKAIKIQHRGNLQDKLNIAKVSLNFAKQRFEKSIDEYRSMANKPISIDQFDRYLEKVFDIGEACDHKAYESILTNFGEGQGNRGETFWDAYNGITEWLDHQRGRTPETRLESAWFGDSARIRSKAHDFALAMSC